MSETLFAIRFHVEIPLRGFPSEAGIGGILNTVWARLFESYTVGSLGAFALWDAASRGLAPEGPPEVDSTLKPSPNSIYMRNLLGWLETRPAQITLNYLNIAYAFLLFKVIKHIYYNLNIFEPA